MLPSRVGPEQKGVSPLRVCDGTEVSATATLIASRLARGIMRDNLPGRLSDRALWPYSAGLYSGLAGVGYALLRAARPDLVRSPLLWYVDGT